MNRIATATVAVIGIACRSTAPDYVGISTDYATGSSAIRGDALVAAFDFETFASDGKLWDFSGNDNHGSMQSHLRATGPVGGALRFEHVEHRIDLPENPVFDLDGPMTVAAWIRIDSVGLHQHVLACDDKFALWITPANQFRLGDTHGGGFSTPEGLVQRDRWYSVVAVLRATRGDTLTNDDVAIYVDGTPSDASVWPRAQAAHRPVAMWSSTVLHQHDACYIGFESHQGNEPHQLLPFVGAVDELIVSARAWQRTEIEAFSAIVAK